MAKFKIKNIIAFFGHLSPRERNIFLLAFFFIFLAIFDRLLISPILSNLDNLNKEIKDTETNIKNNLRILAQKERILGESKRYASFLRSSKSEEEETTSLLKEVEHLANSSSVYIVDMKPLSLKEIGNLKKYAVSLNAEAPMEQMVNFLYRVENSDKLLIIERYQLSLKSKESSLVQINLVIAKIVFS